MDALGDVGDPPRPLPAVHPQQILAVKADFAAPGFLYAKDILEQRRLPAAVFAQHDPDLPVVQRQVDAVQHCGSSFPVAKMQITDLQHQSCSPFRPKMIARKKGAPSSEVIAPTGRAEPLPRLRESVSASRRRMLPLSAEAGIDTR